MEEEGDRSLRAFVLYPNYPNPFNGRTLLSFSLPESRPEVELAVYDLLGQKLAVLVRGGNGGRGSTRWSGTAATNRGGPWRAARTSTGCRRDRTGRWAS